jgi:hypothetical protein
LLTNFKDPGVLFQVFEVHSSEAPLYSADKPPPRKRKRVESSKCEHTNELKSMWTYLEGLAAQLGVLEEVTQVRDYQDSVTYKTVLAAAAIISHNVPVLKEEEKANLNSQSPPSLPPSSRAYRCPAFNCNQYFQRLDLFHQHIRGSCTNEHKILKNIIDQTCCLRCDKSFSRSKDLVNHERSLHGEQYESRVFKFTGSQGQDPNPEPPRDVALNDMSEATDYMPTTTKTIGNVCAPQHSSLPHLSTDVSELNIDFAEPSNADLFSHSTFRVFQQPLGGPRGIPRDSSPNSNAQVWEGNLEFAELSNADLCSYSAFHVFKQPVEEDPCVLQHDSLPNSNAQASRVGVELHGPSSADVFPHSSQLLLEQHMDGQLCASQHDNRPGSNVQTSALNVQFAEPLDRNIFANSTLNFFSEPLYEELLAGQDKALIGTGPPPDLRYLQSLGGHL